MLACVLVATGCGGDKPPSDTEQVRSVLTTFAGAVQRHDYDKLCSDVFAPKLLEGLQEIGLPCQQAMRRAFDEVKDPQLSVDQVEVKGAAASARVRTSASNQQPSADVVRLQKVKGRWRVSQLGSATPAG